MKYRILITGATGFIGQHLTKTLEDEGHEVWRTYEKSPSAERAVLFDLEDSVSVFRAVETCRPQVVIHLAAKTEVALSFENYLQVSSVNYVGTVALAEACHRVMRDEFQAFVMASTMETYGHHSAETPFDENTPQRPAAPYAVAKLACEKYLDYMRYAYSFPSITLRQTNTYGRRGNDFFVMERIISQMVQRDVCRLGDPSPYRNFLWIGDLCRLYSTILNNLPKALHETFVTGPNNAVSIRTLAEMVASKLGWEGEVEWHTVPPRPGEIYYLNSNPAKAWRHLGWKPEVSLSEGLDRTIEIWKSNLK